MFYVLSHTYDEMCVSIKHFNLKFEMCITEPADVSAINGSGPQADTVLASTIYTGPL